MASAPSYVCLLLLAGLIMALSAAQAQALSPTFYDKSCHGALDTIKTAVAAAVKNDRRMGASLLRLHFHDCFVQGCDGSVLLSGNEQNAGPNAGSLRGLNVIDDIKTKVEVECKKTVSCADILAVAARDAVVELGGPSWTVSLGRNDSRTAGTAVDIMDLPSPDSSRVELEAMFLKKGLNLTDMVALSGAHTIGKAQCQNFRARLYGDGNINGDYAKSLRGICPKAVGQPGDSNLAALDATAPPDAFDNKYYSNLMSQEGLLHSDQVLFNNDTTDDTVKRFASDEAAFRGAFVAAMEKMGALAPLPGTKGEVRLSCSKVNS